MNYNLRRALRRVTSPTIQIPATALAIVLALAPGHWTTAPASAQTQPTTERKLLYGATSLTPRRDAAMQRFRDNRVGAFIHWGLYAIPGGTWDGKVYPGAAEWLKVWAKVPSKDWLALMKQWNPTRFDAHDWVRRLKAAGFRYVKLTTKHHEGFCLWPSKTTRYTVAHTPYKRDIVGQIVEACKDEGLDVHFYFSIMDWSDPDYRSALRTAADSAAFERFKARTEAQLRELATRYPTVRDFWFDGTWDPSIKTSGAWTAHLEKMLKQLVPGVTVNSRLRADDFGSRHFDSNGHLMGDYESGYERRLPDPVTDLKVTRYDWEACMTLPENQWGYHKDWSLSYVKTPWEVVDRIVHAVSMGGNMVVNFGPKPDGTFRREELNLMDTLGTWLGTNGVAVYGCGYAGLKKQDWGYYTAKGDTVFMVVFNVPYSGRLDVVLKNKWKVAAATLLDGTNLKVNETDASAYNVVCPSPLPTAPFVIRLTIDRSAAPKGVHREALT